MKKQQARQEDGLSNPHDEDKGTFRQFDVSNITTRLDHLNERRRLIVLWLQANYKTTTPNEDPPQGRDLHTPKAEVWNHYVGECKRLGVTELISRPGLGRLVHQAFPGLRSTRIGRGGGAQHCYKGLQRADVFQPLTLLLETQQPSSTLGWMNSSVNIDFPNVRLMESPDLSPSVDWKNGWQPTTLDLHDRPNTFVERAEPANKQQIDKVGSILGELISSSGALYSHNQTPNQTRDSVGSILGDLISSSGAVPNLPYFK